MKHLWVFFSDAPWASWIETDRKKDRGPHFSIGLSTRSLHSPYCLIFCATDRRKNKCPDLKSHMNLQGCDHHAQKNYQFPWLWGMMIENHMNSHGLWGFNKCFFLPDLVSLSLVVFLFFVLNKCSSLFDICYKDVWIALFGQSPRYDIWALNNQIPIFRNLLF